MTPNEKLFVETFVSLFENDKDVTSDSNLDLRYDLSQDLIAEHMYNFENYLDYKMENMDEDAFDEWIENIKLEEDEKLLSRFHLPTEKVVVTQADFKYWMNKFCNVIRKCYNEIQSSLSNDEGVVYGYYISSGQKYVGFNSFQVADNPFATKNYKEVKDIIKVYKKQMDTLFDEFKDAQDIVSIKQSATTYDFITTMSGYNYSFTNPEKNREMAKNKLDKLIAKNHIQFVSQAEYENKKDYYDKKIAKLTEEYNAENMEEIGKSTSATDDRIIIYKTEEERESIYNDILETFVNSAYDYNESRKEAKEEIENQGIVDLYCMEISQDLFVRQRNSSANKEMFEKVVQDMFSYIGEETEFNRENNYYL